MTEETDRRERDKRAERLKVALRENLRRRKAQVRGRSEPPRVESAQGDPPQPAEDEPRPKQEAEPREEGDSA